MRPSSGNPSKSSGGSCCEIGASRRSRSKSRSRSSDGRPQNSSEPRSTSGVCALSETVTKATLLRSAQQREGAPHGYSQAAMARLERYSFGRILVDGQEHTRDVIVLPGRVVGDWWRREG